ncbi:helix-turn-helix domain-containing protein [Massilia aurea]|uniref:helix-turn-helix domain-containing protein n=1 Tax=Massilia aurea TaxID=373040 RepID=UPI0021611DFB|nr:helix-turn-helix transcriptional regulator [Massilia aurea]MCS0706485.1 helix-turn-helix domain-containing protein [Massilia aurea]
MDPGFAFGKVLRTVRKDAGLTQEQLALAADIDRTFVSLMERGERQPTIRVLFKLATALHVPPARLIQLTEERVALGMT